MSDPVTTWSDLPEREVIPGFHGRALSSERMTFVRWRLDKGAALPLHSHPHEQVLMVFSGVFEATMQGETNILTAGMVLVIPPDVPHEGRVLEDADVLDVFAPVREDYRDGAPSVIAAALR